MLPPFHVVYQQHFDFVWSSVRRLGAAPESMDDLVQEIFLVVYNKLSTVEKPEALRSWIYGIARRTVSDYRRARRSRAAVGLSHDVEAVTASPAPTPHEQTEARAELELLGSLLDQLDEPKREVFALVELQELSVPEAADILQIPLNTAYSRLRAARRGFEEAVLRHEARSKGR